MNYKKLVNQYLDGDNEAFFLLETMSENAMEMELQDAEKIFFLATYAVMLRAARIQNNVEIAAHAEKQIKKILDELPQEESNEELVENLWKD